MRRQLSLQQSVQHQSPNGDLQRSSTAGSKSSDLLSLCPHSRLRHPECNPVQTGRSQAKQTLSKGRMHSCLNCMVHSKQRLPQLDSLSATNCVSNTALFSPAAEQKAACRTAPADAPRSAPLAVAPGPAAAGAAPRHLELPRRPATRSACRNRLLPSCLPLPECRRRRCQQSHDESRRQLGCPLQERLYAGQHCRIHRMLSRQQHQLQQVAGFCTTMHGTTVSHARGTSCVRLQDCKQGSSE